MLMRIFVDVEEATERFEELVELPSDASAPSASLKMKSAPALTFV